MMMSPVVRSGRAALATDCVGDGRPVVFLHAGVADRRMWRHQVAASSGSHRAIAYDRRGFGSTAPVDEGFSQVGDLLAVLEQLAGAEAPPAALVGCSQGGRIAIDAALSRPDRVRALVLVAPAVSGAPPAPAFSATIQAILDELAAAEAAADLDRVNALEARIWLDGPLSPESRVAGAPRELFLEMNGIALRAPQLGVEEEPAPAYDRLHEIRVPTLVIVGDLDFPHIQERCRHIAATIPGARLHVLAQTAHLPSLEQPESVSALIAGFVA